ncbi:MAG TPA: NAD-dependent epimerase/dehydratase family protein, partial [Gemmatimonadales bacterium]|nr:NAD-dependent epimerase/dehydratase family protein [Gemmatimonadales bacterium]
MRVLVTGAAGFIGSHVVERLLGRGDDVIGLDNFDPFYSPAEKRGNLSGALASRNFQLVEADLAEAASVSAAMRGRSIDAIIHLAAKAGVRPSIDDPVGYTRANVLGTQVLLAEAARSGIRRFVFASSSSVYGDSSVAPFSETETAAQPISPYAATKRAGELLCYTHQLLHGGSLLCLRFFTVYGPRQRPDLAMRKFATLMTEGKAIPLFGDGSTERDYTWVGDIVDGVVAAVDRGARAPEEFEIINLGGSVTTSLIRLVELLGQALDVTPRIEYGPP